MGGSEKDGRITLIPTRVPAGMHKNTPFSFKVVIFALEVLYRSMTTSDNFDSVFLEFPPVTTDQWEEAILHDLKGADYQKKLVWKNPDGIAVKPYYTKEDLQGIQHLQTNPGAYPFIRGNQPEGNPWLIRQDVSMDKGLGQAIEKVNYLLDRGVESVNFITEDPEKVDASALLEAIDFSRAEYHFQHFLPDRILTMLGKKVGQGGVQPNRIRGGMEWDPLSAFMLSGKWPDEEQSFDYLVNCMKQGCDYPGFRLIGVNARHFKHAGSTIMQELAYGLAMGNDYLAEMTERGLPVEEAARKISFNFCVGPNYFFEIAKFRAARLIWTRIQEVYGLKDRKAAQMHIHAESSVWNKTVYDPNVNLLRTTTEGMAAILGGVHSLTLLPFDFTYQAPNEFSERLARNQQILLREEAWLDKVADPAGGSYYIESLTHQMAELAWTMFQEIERNGGFTECFYQGWIQNRIVTAAQSRDEGVAQRREILLGTNQYPDLEDFAVDRVDLSRVKSPVPSSGDAEAQPLILYRGAEAFESLRLATEQSGKRPKVFMLTIGHLAMRRARAGFSGNFFGCAGYEIIDNNGFDSVEMGCQAALEAKADLVVLCSSDDAYDQFAPAAFRLLKDKSILVVAGYPVNLVERLRGEGITRFIHVKSNVLKTLQEFNTMLGIPTNVEKQEEKK